MKGHNCKICGKYSGKGDTCKECKEKYPYQSKQRGSNPFNRIKEYEKKKDLNTDICNN